MTAKCPKCGAERQPDETECFQCGVIFEKYQAFLSRQQQVAQPGLAPPDSALTVAAAPTNSNLAIWSLVLGLLSPFCCSFFTAIPAIILGHMARSEIRKSNGQLGGDGMALAGLILGYVAIVLNIIFLFVGLMGVIIEEISKGNLLE